MFHSRKAFTMIELIFVIVILGILSSVAISKMAVTRDDAIIAKGRSQVAAIRNAITIFRNTQMLQGNGATWVNSLDGLSTATSSDGDALFDNNGTATATLLDYPIYAKDENGHWRKTANNTYSFKVLDTDVTFIYGGTNGVTVGGKTYGAGQFDCKHGTANDAEKYCKALTE